MARRLIWSPRAKADLVEIAEYIDRSSPGNAKAVVRRIFTRAGQLPDQPGQGRRVPEYDGDRDLREVFVHRWRVIYLASETSVQIVAIIHGARLIRNVDPFDV